MVIALVAAIGFTAWVVHHESSGPVAGAGTTPGYVAPTPLAPSLRLKALTSNDVVVVGDSWCTGYGSTNPAADGWQAIVAKDLGWNVTAYGWSGSGYAVKVGTPPKNFADRDNTLAVSVRVSLVVMQGSVNDFLSTDAAITSGFDDAVAALRGKFPSAQIVAFGPLSPQQGSVNRALEISALLSYAADQKGVVYLDPDGSAAGPWFPYASIPGYINAAASHHPNDSGYQQIATKFEAAFKAASGAAALRSDVRSAG